MLALLLVVPTLFAQTAAPAPDSIRKDDLRNDLFFLASDAMKGRLTNTSIR